MRNKKREMKFYKYGIAVFDARAKEYGGFNHFIAKNIFKWRLCYLSICLNKKFKFEVKYNDDDTYYDGYHNHIWLGWLLIYWGT
jgi:hypothetical protein